MTKIFERKAQIIATAKKLFNQLGYENTSMRKIAEAVGSGKASLYYYFKSKEEIFLQIIEDESAEYLTEQAANLENETDQIGKLRSFLMIPAMLFEKHSTLIIKMFFNMQKVLLQKPRKRVLEMKEMFFKVFNEILEQGIKNGEVRADFDIERFTKVFFCNMHGILFSSYPEELEVNKPEVRIENYKLMLDIMIEGIKRK